MTMGHFLIITAFVTPTLRVPAERVEDSDSPETLLHAQVPAVASM